MVMFSVRAAYVMNNPGVVGATPAYAVKWPDEDESLLTGGIAQSAFWLCNEGDLVRGVWF
jgi:hypothetical protein